MIKVHFKEKEERQDFEESTIPKAHIKLSLAAWI